jgi:hypothetical protein
MATLRNFLTRGDRISATLGSTVQVGHTQSARIAEANPGPGIPLSTLPSAVQQRLREGQAVVPLGSTDDRGSAAFYEDAGHVFNADRSGST